MKMGKDGQPEDLLKTGTPETAEETESRNEKPTFGSKLESFWYFYKWHTIIGVVLAIALAISMVQLFKNVNPDAYIMYVGKATLYVKNKDAMTERAKDDIYDYNNDGKKHVALLEITVAVGEDLPYTAFETNVDANKRFLSELASGDSVVYLLEESFYKKAAEQGLLCPLAEIVDPSVLPDDMYDEYSVRVCELDYFKQDGFSSVPDDTLLCIRRSPDKDSISYGRTPEYWACNKALIKEMLEFRLPAEEKEEKVITAFDNGRYDVVIGVYDTARHYESDGENLAYAASGTLKDVNSDGRTLLAIDPVLLGGNTDAEAYLLKQTESGKEIIFIANAEYYAKLRESGILRPLEEIIGNYAEKLGCADGYGIQLKNLKWFAEKPFFKNFDGELYICVTTAREDLADESAAAFYEGNIAFFKAMATYKIEMEQ